MIFFGLIFLTLKIIFILIFSLIFIFQGLAQHDPKILPLPAPPQKKSNHPWETLHNLAELDKEYVFVQKEKPHLTLRPVPQWSESTLQTVLDIDAVNIFSSQSHLNYLRLFLQDDAVAPFLKVSSHQRQLKEILRNGFLQLGERMSQVTSGVRDIVSFVLPDGRFILKSNAHSIIRKLQDKESDILILHKDFDHQECPGTAKLSVNEALQILNNLDQQLRNYENERNNTRTEKCREVIFEILRSLTRDTRHEILKRGRTLKIITGYDCQLQRDSSFTIEELENYHRRASLFLYTQGVNLTERLGLSHKLQAVFPEDKVILLSLIHI